MSEKQTIVGSKAIASYIGRSIPTIMRLQIEANLPMYLLGGVWQVDKEDIEEWIQCQKEGRFYEKEVKKPKEKKQSPHEIKKKKEDINNKLVDLGLEPLPTKGNSLAKFEKALEKALA